MRRRVQFPELVALVAITAVSGARSAQAEPGTSQRAAQTAQASYLEPIAGADAGRGDSQAVSKSSRASRYAALSTEACRRELARRKLPVIAVKRATVGVSFPVRITGPLSGVRFVTPSKKSPYSILDCRLAIALSDFAEVLARHDVVTVQIDNMYRPKARLPGRKKPSQHSFGLAVDMTRFILKGGADLVIERDFEGEVGQPVCGGAARPASELSDSASKLRDLVCDVARSELFHHILTPNHDAAHRDHLHLDIAKGARQRIIE